MSIAKPTSDVSLGRYLTLVREDVGLNQAELAAKVGVSPATMSRIESGSKAPSDQEVAAILKAIGTQRARDLADYLRQDWNRLDRPPFDHPDLASLRIAELALAKLDRLREMPGLQNTFRRKADLYEGELRRLADFLALRTHPIAFIGTIGVGKSTAISSLTALENVLPTGAGRTTICEVCRPPRNPCQLKR